MKYIDEIALYDFELKIEQKLNILKSQILKETTKEIKLVQENEQIKIENLWSTIKALRTG